MPRRLVPSLVFALLTTSGCALRASAPVPADVWARVVNVAPGTTVRVWWTEPPRAGVRRHRTDGSLSRADDSEVELTTGTGQLRIARAQVSRLDLLIGGGDSLTNGMLAGAAVGAGYGSFVLWRVGSEADGTGFVPVVCAGLGAAIGGAIDAMRRGHRSRTVYRVSP